MGNNGKCYESIVMGGRELMDLIDKYVNAVGRRLWKNRKDIETELRSTLLDMLEERTGGQRASEKEIVELLREFGHPIEVARKYNGDRQYLIGPRLYPLYIMIIKIICLVVPFGLIIATIVKWLQVDGENLIGDIFLIIPQFFSAIIGAIGIITITFALTERFGDVPEDKLTLIDKNWNPKDLPETTKEYNRIKIPGKIVSICFTVFFLILINFFKEKLGIYYVNGVGEWKFIPIFTSYVLNKFIPIWSIMMIITIGLDVMLIRRGRWQRSTRLLDILIAIVNMIIFIAFITTPDIINAEVLRDLMPSFRIIFKVFKYGFRLLVIPIVIDIVKKIYLFIKYFNK